MPHLLKEYSKNLGVEANLPIVNKHFYPVFPENYIVIYNEQDIQSKSYAYYEIVVGLIKKTLEKLNYSVVVIGSSKNLFGNADYFYPELSFKKNCYIVSKAKALVSIDNALTQYAGSCNVPVVNLYGNIYPTITTSYWSSKSKKIDLEPEWDIKPCLSLVDPKDSINKIKVEDVASSILNVIGLPVEVGFKTKLRNKTKGFQVDVIPTKYVNLPVFRNNIINLRLDQETLNQEAFLQYCSNHKCNIFIKDSLLSVDLIKNIGANIESLVFICNKIPDKIPDLYFDLLKRLKIRFIFLVRNKEILDEMRLQYFDQEVEYQDPHKEKPSDIDVSYNFISFKCVIEGDKSYKCLAHWKKGVDFSDKVLDNSLYWEELDYFYIYEQENND